MKAISLTPHTTDVQLTEENEPAVHSANDIKLKVLEVGICGTDREEAAGGRAEPPRGKTKLVLGHEVFGKVVQTGSGVTAAAIGDYGMFTVRRGCGECVACNNDRSDMCFTGRYTERGIKGADGFQTEYVVDDEKFFVKIPGTISDIGVLTEPMSVAAKAIDEALIIQHARMQPFLSGANWLKGKKALVAGIGPIGLMAAFALRLQGADVIGLDIVDENSLRVQLLKQIGGSYIDGRTLETTDIDESFGEADLVFEATGIAKLQIQLIDTLAPNGIYVATGIPSGERPVTIMAADIMQQLVLNNQVLVGSVNAGVLHYKQAVDYLVKSKQQWPDAITRVITEKITYTNFHEALLPQKPDEIKVVVTWN